MRTLGIPSLAKVAINCEPWHVCVFEEPIRLAIARNSWCARDIPAIALRAVAAEFFFVLKLGAVSPRTTQSERVNARKLNFAIWVVRYGCATSQPLLPRVAYEHSRDARSMLYAEEAPPNWCANRRERPRMRPGRERPHIFVGRMMHAFAFLSSIYTANRTS